MSSPTTFLKPAALRGFWLAAGSWLFHRARLRRPKWTSAATPLSRRLTSHAQRREHCHGSGSWRFTIFIRTVLRSFSAIRRPHEREQLNSIGSGVIIDEDGYMLTNLHVLRRAHACAGETLGRKHLRRRAAGGARHRSDVALLKLKAKPGEKFQAIKFAKDDDLLLGETVLALGNPYGLGGSVSRGILSSKNRRPRTGASR